MLEELGAALRSHSGRHRQGRAARARLSRHQSERQGAGDRRHRGAGRARGAGVRFERDPALPRRKDRALHRRSRRSAGTAVVAVLHRHRGGSVLGSGGAFPARGAGKAPVRRQPISARDRAPLSRAGQASGGPRASSSAATIRSPTCRPGVGSRAPRACCRARTIRSPHFPNLKRLFETVDARPAAARAKAIGKDHPLQDRRSTRRRSARCSRRTIRKSRCDLESSGPRDLSPPGPVASGRRRTRSGRPICAPPRAARPCARSRP